MLTPTLQGSTSAATTSVALPTHVIGNLIILHIYVNASTTQATKPAASGTVPNWNILEPVTTTTGASQIAWFVATAANHTSGTWTGATNIIATVIQGQSGSSIGAHASSSGSQVGASTAPAVTQTVTNGKSLLLHFMSTQTTNPPVWSAAPAGYTQRVANGRTLFITKDDTTTDGAVTNADNGSSNVGWTGITLEIPGASQKWRIFQ
jgi:hypothetical protein